MLEGLNDRARLVVSSACHEAHEIRWTHIGSKHLLLGMLRDQESLAAEALRTAGVGFEAARREMFRHICIGDDGDPTDDRIALPLTPRALEV
jgi:ATP-dependent Clp protease ATP-binding subunit ClpC